MHTPSTRILSAVAYDCGIEDFDPTDPVCLELVDALTLAEHAAAVVGEDGPYEKARQRRRERDRTRSAVPDWFSAQDLIAAPWEPAVARFL
jgi:hypothetical protein